MGCGGKAGLQFVIRLPRMVSTLSRERPASPLGPPASLTKSTLVGLLEGFEVLAPVRSVHVAWISPMFSYFCFAFVLCFV